MFERLFTLVAAFLFVAGGYCTHLIGGEIYYECLGNNEFLVTLKIYRDCSPNNTNGTGFDQNASIGFFDQNGDLQFSQYFPLPGGNVIPNNSNNPCWVAPPDVCVEEAVYSEVVFIPPIAGGYDVAYQRCCRNPSTVNIINPSDVGSTYVTHIPDAALAVCNSAPYYNEFPPTILCANAPLVFDHSATDPDGDSLVYELCEPFIGGSPFDPQPAPPPSPPYGTVPWASGYSGTSPMDGAPALAIDPVSGLMTGTPTMVGQFVVGVCVSEYRNGVLLSTNKRDFQFTVAPCDANVVSSIQDQTVFCDGLYVEFGNLSLNGQTYFWDFGDLSSTTDTTTAFAPNYTYPDTGEYTVSLVVNPGWPCADTSYNTFEMYPPILPEFTPPPSTCFDGNALSFQAGGQFYSYADFLWEFPGAIPSSSTAQNPSGIQFNSLGGHEVTLTIFENGCQESYVDSLVIYPNPIPSFNALEKEGCAPFTTQFIEASSAWTDLEWHWDFGDGTTSNDTTPGHTWVLEGTYDVTLTVSTDSGCVDTASFLWPGMITVNPVPVASFQATPDRLEILDPTVQVLDHSIGASSWQYDMGDGTVYVEPNFLHQFNDGGLFNIMQVVQNEFSCSDTAWQEVVVVDQIFFAPNAFTPNGDGLNDVFIPSVRGAQHYELRIFDRWGQVIFQTNDRNIGWDGTKGGREAPIDTYLFKASVTDIGNRELKYSGHFTLVR